MRNPFRYLKTSPEVIRLAVMMYVRFPLPLRQVEDLLHERGIDICHETARSGPENPFPAPKRPPLIRTPPLVVVRGGAIRPHRDYSDGITGLGLR